MIARLIEFESRAATQLLETYARLQLCNLTFHPRVFRIALHDSHGLGGGYRPDSDIDLCLVVETKGVSNRPFNMPWAPE